MHLNLDEKELLSIYLYDILIDNKDQKKELTVSLVPVSDNTQV